MPVHLNVKHPKTWSCDPQTFIVSIKRKYLLVTHVKCTKILLLIFSKQKNTQIFFIISKLQMWYSHYRKMQEPLSLSSTQNFSCIKHRLALIWYSFICYLSYCQWHISGESLVRGRNPPWPRNRPKWTCDLQITMPI